MNAIETNGLGKSFGHTAVLRDLSLRVPPGCLFGFLGPNGAGKSTTIRILLGLLRASAGSAAIFGHDVWQQGVAARSGVGYLPGDLRFYDTLTGAATLDFLAAARRHPCPARARLVERFGLPLDRRVRAYSSGMKQKLGLVAAMMHEPRLLILDEPTNALDPLVRGVLYEELRAVAAAGRTVLFSSHTLSEVEELCDEVAILRDGELVARDRVAALRVRAPRHVEILFGPDGYPELLPEGMHQLDRRGQRLVAAWTGSMPDLLGWIGRHAVEDVTIGPPDLSDLFMTYYRQAPPAEVPA